MAVDCSKSNIEQVMYEGKVWNKASYNDGFNECRLENPKDKDDFIVAN